MVGVAGDAVVVVSLLVVCGDTALNSKSKSTVVVYMSEAPVVML